MAHNRKKLTVSTPLPRNIAIAACATQEFSLASQTIPNLKGKGSFTRKEKHRITY